MLEKIVTLFLQKYIGDFLELSKTQLKFGVIRGRIDLKDLKPKLGNLDFFGLPIKVIYESIEHLRFNVPYNHLKTKPTVLEISGVHILFNLLQDKEQKSWEEREQISFKRKQSQIKKWEKQQTKSGRIPSVNSKENSALASETQDNLLTKIATNIIIKITDVHLRCESKLGSTPFAFGCLLHKIVLHPANDKWEKVFIKTKLDYWNKMVEFVGLGFYLDLGVRPTKEKYYSYVMSREFKKLNNKQPQPKSKPKSKPRKKTEPNPKNENEKKEKERARKTKDQSIIKKKNDEENNKSTKKSKEKTTKEREIEKEKKREHKESKKSPEQTKGNEKRETKENEKKKNRK